jgi:hypothetical protein
MSHLSVQTKLARFFKPAFLRSKTKYNFWIFYRWINVLSFYSFKQRLYSDILLFIFIRSTYVIKFSIYLCFSSFGAIFCFINPDDLFPQLLEISEGLLYKDCGVCMGHNRALVTFPSAHSTQCNHCPDVSCLSLCDPRARSKTWPVLALV